MRRNARRISTLEEGEKKLEEDVDLSPEREQASITVRTVLVKYAGQLP